MTEKPAILNLQGKPPGCKLLRLSLTLTKDPNPIIQSISIHGDFFAVPEEAFDAVERELAGTTPAQLGRRFNALAEAHSLQLAGISGDGLDTLIASEAPWLLNPEQGPRHAP